LCERERGRYKERERERERETEIGKEIFKMDNGDRMNVIIV